MLLLAAATFYAIRSGRSVNFWRLQIGGGPEPTKSTGASDDVEQRSCQRGLADANKRATTAEQALAAAIVQHDIPNLWPEGKPKSEIVPALAQAGQECDDDRMLECLYAKLKTRSANTAASSTFSIRKGASSS